MCSILLLVDTHPDHPVLVAANRDEHYGRPSTTPDVIVQRPRTVAGVDLEAGGTWMGATADGFFAGLTNQPGPVADINARAWRSRGLVVREVLEAGGTQATNTYLERLDPSLYQPFNLAFGDVDGLSVAYVRPDEVRIEAVAAGAHVLPNGPLDNPAFPKVRRGRALLEGLDLDADDARDAGDFSAFARLLADSALPPLEEVPEPEAGTPFTRDELRRLHAICVSTPHYGTRSATIIALDPGRVARYLFAPGPTSCAGFGDVTSLLYPDRLLSEPMLSEPLSCVSGTEIESPWTPVSE